MVAFMNIKKNKNGFTLVELLAVIVILAVIILIASNSVLSQMDRARKNALAIEGNTLINSAKNAYQSAILEGKITTGSACFPLEYLYKEGLFSKGKKDNYTGSVLVAPDSSGKIVTYTFWISNGSYIVSGETGTNGSGASNGTSASENCGNASGAKLFS